MARLTRATRKRLGEILIEQGVLDDERLLAALQEQKRTGELLGEALVRMGYTSEDDIANCMVLQFGLPYLSVKSYSISKEMASIFPARLLRQYAFVPIDRIGHVVAVVAGLLLTPEILSELEQMSGSRIQVFAGKQSDIKDILDSRFAEEEKKEEAAAAAVEKKAASESSLSSLGSMLLGE